MYFEFEVRLEEIEVQVEVCVWVRGVIVVRWEDVVEVWEKKGQVFGLYQQGLSDSQLFIDLLYLGILDIDLINILVMILRQGIVF